MGIDTADFLVTPVEGKDDTFAFTFDFVPEAKALVEGDAAPQLVTALDDGDLIIEGWAAVFEGVDRQGENFTDGAFQRGVKAFLNGSASLCYHHDRSMALGKVLDLEEVEGKGLRMKARIDGAIRQHPTLGTYYEQIKKGTLSALSVGGFFRRKLTEAGWRIGDMDFTEISVTPVPIHPSTKFAVVAGKALDSNITILPDVDEISDEDVAQFEAALESLGRIIDRLEKHGGRGAA